MSPGYFAEVSPRCPPTSYLLRSFACYSPRNKSANLIQGILGPSLRLMFKRAQGAVIYSPKNRHLLGEQ